MASFAYAVNNPPPTKKSPPKNLTEKMERTNGEFGQKIVNSLAEDFMWPNDYFDCIGSGFVEDANGLIRFGNTSGPIFPTRFAADPAAQLFARNVSTRTISLSYAGIDAPGTSLIMSAATAEDRGHIVRKPRVIRAIEQDEACQRELKLHPSNVEMLVSDLDQLWIPQIRQAMRAIKESNKKITLDSLLPLVLCAESIVSETFDIITKSLRPLVTSDIEVAGISCRAFSPIGSREKEGSWEMTALAAWACLMLKVSPSTIVVEESSMFDVAILHKLLGTQYVVQANILDGVDFGHPVRRKRLGRGRGIHRRAFCASVSDFMCRFVCWMAALVWANSLGLRVGLRWLSYFEEFNARSACTLCSTFQVMAQFALPQPQPQSSPSLYAVLHHRTKVGEAIVSMSNVLKMCHREIGPNFHYRTLMVGHHANMKGDDDFPVVEDEKYQELVWSWGRAKSSSHTRDLQELMDERDPYYHSLTQPEQKILADYKNAHSPATEHGFVCNLNQKPANDRGVSSDKGIMYTIIANPSLHYVSRYMRWITPHELLLLQGFPIVKQLTCFGPSARPATSFAFPMADRSRRDICRQAGNSMQVMVIGAVLQYVVMFTRWPVTL